MSFSKLEALSALCRNCQAMFPFDNLKRNLQQAISEGLYGDADVSNANHHDL